MSFQVRNKNSDDVSHFAQLCEVICKLGQSAGVRILASHGTQFPIFSTLPQAQRQLILADLESYVSVCQGCLQMGGKLSDSKALLWSMMRHFGLKPSSDLFSYVTDDQLIEIYNMDHVQIFRNFKFFELVSYTLEDLFCRPRFELFHRPDPQITEMIGSALTATLQAPNQVHQLAIPQHEVHELDSVFMCQFSMKINYGSVLTDSNHRSAAYLVLEEAKLTFAPGPDAQERLLLQKQLRQEELFQSALGAQVIPFSPRSEPSSGK